MATVNNPIMAMHLDLLGLSQKSGVCLISSGHELVFKIDSKNQLVVFNTSTSIYSLHIFTVDA